MNMQNAIVTAATVAALSCISTQSSAKLVTVDDQISISLSSGPSKVIWDIGQRGGTDVYLYTILSAIWLYGGAVGPGPWCSDPGEPTNTCIAPLSDGFTVGQTLEPDSAWAGPDIHLLQANSITGTHTGKIGVSFWNGSGSGYGWANLVRTADMVSIDGWTYDDAGAPVTVGQVAAAAVPIPPMIMPALAVMALAGLWKVRREKNERTAIPA